MTGVSRHLQSQRLVLEGTSVAHADAMWEAVRASLEELRPWMSWAQDPALEDTLAFVTAAERNWDRASSWNFTIIQDDRPIGSIGLEDYDSLAKSCTLGYWLRSDCAGRGFMTEAASLVLEFGFVELGLHRIELRAAAANHASMRVAAKLGFKREGLLRDGSRGAEGWHDTYIYGLLRDDPWPTARAKE